MMTLIELRTPHTDCGKGAMLFALAYAPGTRTLFCWLGRHCYSFLIQDDSPAYTGAGRWSW